MVRRKTNPDHKARLRIGVTAMCSCGWTGVTAYGQGARGEAAKDWWTHREWCEATRATGESS